MQKVNYLIFIGLLTGVLACSSLKTEQEKEYDQIKKYIPADFKSHGFTLPVDSKVPEVHQLFNDLEANFFFYKDKSTFETLADRIIQLDPEYPSAYLMKSFYETDTVEYEKLVTKAFELSKKSTLKSEKYMVQADYYLLIKKDYARAQEFFQKALDIHPNSAAAVWSLGMAYYYDGLYDKAFDCYKKSTELIPDLPKGYELMAGVYYRKKDYKKALTYLQKAAEHGANARNDVDYAEFISYIYYRNGQYDKAISSVKEAYTYGERHRKSEYLQKAHDLSTAKLDSIKSAGLESR